MSNVETVKVKMWGTAVGYLHQENSGTIGFQYDEDFLGSNIEIAPVKMPLSTTTYAFPTLPEQTFHGLPGLVADSLPDRFGNIVISKYLENQGRTTESLSAIEKLCYVGQRSMGALEYEPSQNILNLNETVDLDALTKLASDILSSKEQLHLKQNDSLMAQLMECGSSVGGARAKTLIAWNKDTGDIRSGQINAGEGYEYWLLKFDNISNNRDKDTQPDDGEYTKIEYAYYLMALDAGIDMSECVLYKENNNSHFMTKRFDRRGLKGEKLHMQSLCAIAHMDFNSPRMYSYEDAFAVMRQLKLPYNDFLQLYKRMLFNEYAKNFDDHTKNISFLMNKQGIWSLAPAYDMTFSYRKDSIWVSAHQMLVNGKADDISQNDLLRVAQFADIDIQDAKECVEQVSNAVQKWEQFARQAELSQNNRLRIFKHLNGLS